MRALHCSPQIEELAVQNNDIVVRKINIQDWGSPVSKQYKLKFVPNVRVYNKKGSSMGGPVYDISQIKEYVSRASD